MNELKKVLFILIMFFGLSVVIKVSAEDIVPPECVPPQTLVNNVCTDPVPPAPTTTTIHLKITTPTSSLYDQDINVNACESDNPASGNLKITAYCAVLQSGLQSDWNFTWPPGIFLNSLNGITGSTTKDAAGNDVYHYWNWSLNGTDGTTGLNEYTLQPNDLIALNFVDPTPPPPPPKPEEQPHTTGGGYIKIEKKVFDIKKAFDFLASQQKANGSFGEDLYTDWTALAFSSTSDYQDQKTKLLKYFSENKNNTCQLLTDCERHAMALMALNIDPYNTGGVNYIQKITDSFDGTQFGDKAKDNDDIFALIVLQNAGYTIKDKQVASVIDFILKNQKADGSWDNSIDLTGAGMEALATFKDDVKVANALTNAKNYLKKMQDVNGGWGNASTTAWAMQGLLSLGGKIEDSTLNYLALNQDIDGGIKDVDLNSKIWETSYVLTSLSGKTWNQIMQKLTAPIVAQKVAEKTLEAPVPKKVTRILKQKVSATPSLETASAIQAVQNTTDNNTPTPKKSWLQRLFSKIFGF